MQSYVRGHNQQKHGYYDANAYKALEDGKAVENKD